MIIKSGKTLLLKGELIPPSDKSISHRAVILSSLNNNISYIKNLLFSDDIRATLRWAKNVGVSFCKISHNIIEVNSTKVDYSSSNNHSLYLANSGTSARLLMGVMAGFYSTCFFNGDSSLEKRPMLRIIKPLTLMGATIFAHKQLYKQTGNIHKDITLKDSNTIINNQNYANGLDLINCKDYKDAYLPIFIKGGNLKGISYKVPIASAQIKSAILLAGLFTNDEVIVQESAPTRDHTENMLIASGINLRITRNKFNVKTIAMPKGIKKLQPNNWEIPSDFSSSAFIIQAALSVPNSFISIKNVNLNPLRTGLLTVLQQMGANINVIYTGMLCGEQIGNIEVRYTKNLKPVTVGKSLVPLMIDEFPVLACLLSLVNGESTFLEIEELRYKESDRILSIETNLHKLGIKTKSTKSSLTIFGDFSVDTKREICLDANLDHRIAMAFLILGFAKNGYTVIKDADTINSSFPNFVNIMQNLGANIAISKE